MAEMEQSDVVTVPECFISSHEGFRGSIKNFTRDFVVTEIDIHGHLINKPITSSSQEEDPHFPPHSIPTKPSGDNTSSEPKQCSSSRVAQDMAMIGVEDYDTNGDVTPSVTTENLDLSVILGASVCEAIEQFAVSVRDPSGLSKETRSEEKQLTGVELLSLGSFPEKHQRANVHRAVRHRFPFLMTITCQSEIKVKECPDFRELAGLVTEEEAEDFFRFIDTKVPGSSHTFLHDADKDHRTAVHHFLSRRFGKLVETKSFGEQGKTAITVRLRERGRPRKRTAEDRSEDDVYTAFILCKENLETLEAISYMAATLGVLPSDFTYAGIKDKRAITYQSMVVKKVFPQRLQEKTSEFEKKGMVVSGVRLVSEPLRMGRLQGNHFDLVVRDLRPHRKADMLHPAPETHAHLVELIEQAVENVKAKGFVNYYGPQRFGTGLSVQSDRVGLALLKEDMVSAVRLVFTPEEGDDPQSQAKRHFLLTDNAKESLAMMPVYKARERLMLQALHRYGTGPQGCVRAWLSLPHGMRVFYLHAYCSRVWNEAVAHRLSTLGHTAREGDLVWAQQEQVTSQDSQPQIHVVTDQEERERVYSLGQVMLPMPGNTVRYPENSMGVWYQKRLARDVLQCCRFRVAALKLNLPGCYRHMLAFPRDLTYRLHGPTAGEGSGGGGGGGGGEGEGEGPIAGEGSGGGGGEGEGEEGSRRDCDGGKSKSGEQTTRIAASEKKGDSASLSLTLNFDLDKSCYATICLREIMQFPLCHTVEPKHN